MSFDADLSTLDPRVIEALLALQADAGVDECMEEAPLDRFAAFEAQKEAAAARAAEAPAAPAGAERRGAAPLRAEPPVVVKVDPEVEARRSAAAAPDLAALAEAMQNFPHSDLKRGARNFLFSEGAAGARVMWITDPPGSAEDRAGQIFAGPSAGLFAKMLGAIGLSTQSPDLQSAVYVAPFIPWPVLGARAQDPGVSAMMVPFLRRHIELAAPDLVVLTGQMVVQALLGKSGLLSLRGSWTEVMGRPALVSLPPLMLLQNTYLKRGSWEDLLSLKARLTP
ncbi:uracil-DNA glycosylase [Falsigemmobacter faecalis]|uniref:Uracil-DNA glycosylase n=1 Tax=Falsigemmobacter faecalis TaxID=2488730 RepID=A0A3P3DDZ6_9RHOB|nr:uracil-DNA glycosylase [Falsigemmobacter faecalis]RRH72503.1 uracil-DNA glycosylase [Falsigemmobacter faecalis]